MAYKSVVENPRKALILTVHLLCLKPWGDPVTHSMMVTLDPVRKGVGERSAAVSTANTLILTSEISSRPSTPSGGRQVEILNSRLPLKDRLLGTPTNAVVSVAGKAALTIKEERKRNV